MKHCTFLIFFVFLCSYTMDNDVIQKKQDIKTTFTRVVDWVDFAPRYFALPDELKKIIFSDILRSFHGLELIKVKKKSRNFYKKNATALICAGIMQKNTCVPLQWRVKQAVGKKTKTLFMKTEDNGFEQVDSQVFRQPSENMVVYGPNALGSFLANDAFLKSRGAIHIDLHMTFVRKQLRCLHPTQNMFACLVKDSSGNKDVYICKVNDNHTISKFPLKNQEYQKMDGVYEHIMFGPRDTILMFQALRKKEGTKKRLVHYNYSNHQACIIDGFYNVNNKKTLFLNKDDLSDFGINKDIIDSFEIFFDDYSYARTFPDYLLVRVGVIAYEKGTNKKIESNKRLFALYNFDTKGYLLFEGSSSLYTKDVKDAKLSSIINRPLKNTKTELKKPIQSKPLSFTWGCLKQHYQGITLTQGQTHEVKNSFGLLMRSRDFYINELVLSSAARQWLDRKKVSIKDGQWILQALKNKKCIPDSKKLVKETGTLFKDVHTKIQKLAKK